MRSSARRRKAVIVGAIALAVAIAPAVFGPFAIGLSLVVRAANVHGWSRWLADRATVSVAERLVAVPVRDGFIQGRVYEPPHARQTVLLVPGVHPAGIDDPRLTSLARELAKSGVTVVTPDIPELSRFEITPLLTDRIEEAAVWVATASGLARTGRIGMIGASFSGGLAIVAAGRPSLRDRAIYVVSIGGHDDLPRLLRFFCADSMAPRAPHDYGVAIVLLGVVERLVPPEQVPALRDAVRRFLRASYIERFDQAEAQHEFAVLRDRTSTLPEPAATVLRHVNDRDVASLGRLVRPHFEAYAEAPALSPARSPAPSAPVFLLHGARDTVIPASESRSIADRQRAYGAVRLLVTELISHADADGSPRAMDVVALAEFWGDVLSR